MAKSILYTYILYSLLTYCQPMSAAEAEIDQALLQLFDNRDIGYFIARRQTEEINNGQYQVRPGDSLDKIIKLAFGDTLIRHEILRQAFVNLNPEAFRNSNPNWLLAGAIIQIPTAEDIQGQLFDNYPAVRQKFPMDTGSWVRYP